MLKQRQQTFVTLLVAADAVAVASACLASWAVRIVRRGEAWPDRWEEYIKQPLILFAVPIAIYAISATRLYRPRRDRSIWGEQIVFSNADLTSSRIRNYKRMKERRITFALGVVYETPADKLERIPGIIRETIASIPLTRFDRAHFKQYGDFALNFEIVYYVLNPEFNVYMDIQQEINLALFRRFKEENIQFAYPTQEIIVRPTGQASTPLP